MACCDLADRGLELESDGTGLGIYAVALGAVRRRMSEFEVSMSLTGTCIKARRWPDLPF